jgi:hypothetical protein
MPEAIDEATPKEAHSRTVFDGNEYELVFSDMFEIEGRTFWPGEFVSFFRFFFVYFLFSSLFIQRDQDLRTFSFGFSLPPTCINCVISESLHPLFFRVLVLRVLSAARGCVCTIDAIFYSSRSQRSDDAWSPRFFFSSLPPAYPFMTMTMLCSYVWSTRTSFECLRFPRIRVLIFVSSKTGGADDMIRPPLCFCSDLGSSLPRWVVCVLFYVFLFVFFVSCRFLFFTILAVHTLVSRASFFEFLPQIQYIPLSGGAGDGYMAAFFCVGLSAFFCSCRMRSCDFTLTWVLFVIDGAFK